MASNDSGISIWPRSQSTLMREVLRVANGVAVLMSGREPSAVVAKTRMKTLPTRLPVSTPPDPPEPPRGVLVDFVGGVRAASLATRIWPSSASTYTLRPSVVKNHATGLVS